MQARSFLDMNTVTGQDEEKFSLPNQIREELVLHL